MDSEWTGKKETYVVDRCEVNESLVEGCQRALQHPDNHLLGFFLAFLVFAAVFSRVCGSRHGRERDSRPQRQFCRLPRAVTFFK